MSKEQAQRYRPFFSLLLIISTLFAIVFFQLEIRRLGYEVLKLSRQEKSLRDQVRVKSVDLARMTGPQSLQQVARNQLTLKKAQPGQIIQMTDQGVVLTQ